MANSILELLAAVGGFDVDDLRAEIAAAASASASASASAEAAPVPAPAPAVATGSKERFWAKAPELTTKNVAMAAATVIPFVIPVAAGIAGFMWGTRLLYAAGAAYLAKRVLVDRE